jgi:hypothetical protein
MGTRNSLHQDLSAISAREYGSNEFEAGSVAQTFHVKHHRPSRQSATRLPASEIGSATNPPLRSGNEAIWEHIGASIDATAARR